MTEFIEILQAILLGIVQGLTEFLPVSSSGHLVFLQLMGVGEPSVFFNILLHIGTLAAAIVALWKPLWSYLADKEMVFKVVLSSIPTFAIALIVELFFEDMLFGSLLGAGFLVTAVVLILTEKLKDKDKENTLEVTRQNALLVGIMQGIAVLPGISRSGMTIGFLRGKNIEGNKAAEYSFIIGMPVILGGAIFEILKYEATSASWSALAIAFGMLASFISGYFAVRVMLKIFAKKSLIPFAIYVILLAVLAFILV